MSELIRATRTRTEPDGFLNAIPNRDLTEDDWAQLDADQRDVVRKSPLYEVKTNDQLKAERSAAEEKATAAHHHTPAAEAKAEPATPRQTKEG